MGAWGHGPFENDDALDWLAELENARDWGPIARAFEFLQADSGYTEAPTCSEAIAAAAVVANGCKPSNSACPDEVSQFLADVPIPPPREIQDNAVRALHEIVTHSELRDLWEETDDFQNWRLALESLRSCIADNNPA